MLLSSGILLWVSRMVVEWSTRWDIRILLPMSYIVRPSRRVRPVVVVILCPAFVPSPVLSSSTVLCRSVRPIVSRRRRRRPLSVRPSRLPSHRRCRPLSVRPRPSRSRRPSSVRPFVVCLIITYMTSRSIRRMGKLTTHLNNSSRSTKVYHTVVRRTTNH